MSSSTALAAFGVTTILNFSHSYRYVAGFPYGSNLCFVIVYLNISPCLHMFSSVKCLFMCFPTFMVNISFFLLAFWVPSIHIKVEHSNVLLQPQLWG